MMKNKYIPEKVWQNNAQTGGTWASINRPIAGATHDKVLPIGSHPLQLYSMGTPNGQKVTILLEELLALGVEEAEYDAHLIQIGQGNQVLFRFCYCQSKFKNSSVSRLLHGACNQCI